MLTSPIIGEAMVHIEAKFSRSLLAYIARTNQPSHFHQTHRRKPISLYDKADHGRLPVRAKGTKYETDQDYLNDRPSVSAYYAAADWSVSMCS